MLKDTLKEKVSDFDIKIFAFAIIDNHYHILIKIEKDWKLPDFIKGVDGKSAFLLNKLDGAIKKSLV